MEFHYDTGAPYGTVQPVKALDFPIPADMAISADSPRLFESLDEVERAVMKKCKTCGYVRLPSRVNTEGFCDICQPSSRII